jgi:predicted ATPase
MAIQRIHVENFRSFSDIDIGLSRFNVVIGSNAAGKSNFISIFKFLRDIAKHGIVHAVAMQGGPEYIQNAKIGPSHDLRIRVIYLPERKSEVPRGQVKDAPILAIQPSLLSYEFAIRFTPGGDSFSVTDDRIMIDFDVLSCKRENTDLTGVQGIGHGQVRVSSDGGIVAYEVDLPEACTLSGDEIIPLTSRARTLPEKTLLLETPYAFPLSVKERFFDRIAVYDIDPKDMKKGGAITGRMDLEEDAGNLAPVLKNIIGNPEKKRKFSNLVRDILPFIEDFSVEKFADIPLVLMLREKYAKNHDLPASSLSDGTLTIFALIVMLYFEDNPFIIIEEPVIYIHPFLVGRIISMMQESSGSKQVMVTTHSTEVVKHASPADLLLVSRDPEGFSVVSRPADKEEVRTFLENEIGIEELFIQNLLGL